MVNKSGHWLSLTVLFLLVIGSFLSACAKPTAPAPAPGTPAPTAPSAQTPAAPAATSLVEAARKEGEIVLWAHTFQAKEAFVKLFKDKYPFLELKIWDASPPDVVSKAKEEGKAGRLTVDVINLNHIYISDLQEMFVPYDWPATKGWDEQYRPSHNLWRYYASSPKVPAYNTDVVSAADAPKSIDDLKNPKWRGKCITSLSNDPLPLNYAWYWRQDGKLNWEKSFAFWEEVVNNTRPRSMMGFEGAMGFVASGEVQLHQTSSINTVFRYIWRGAPVAIARLPEVTTEMWAVAIMKNAPHPNAARLFADFFTSPEGQLAYANAQGVPISSPEAAKVAKTNLAVKELGLKTFMAPPEIWTQENIKKAQSFWSELMRR